MNLIYSRTPHIITCNFDPLQIATKIELTIWRVGDEEPTTPTKVLEKTIFSPTQYANHYNISPFVADFFEFIQYPAVNVVVEKYYKLDAEWIYESRIISVATYGYSQTEISESDYYTLKDSNEIKRYTYPIDGLHQYTIPTLDVLFDFEAYDHLRVLYSSSLGSSFVDYEGVGIELIRVPLALFDTDFANGNFVYFQTFNGTSYDSFDTFEVIPECEPKFKPYILNFVNDTGGLEQMTFFKKSSKSYEVKGNDYNITPFTTYPNIDIRIGQSQVFNKNGNESIKLNTGWISEIETELIKQIALSENLYLIDSITGYESAVKLKTSSFQEKTNLNDKVINYEIELEFANPMINNIV